MRSDEFSPGPAAGRRRFIAAVLAAGATLSLGAAPPPRRIPRVGFLIGTIPGSVSPLETALSDELQRLGLIQGVTIQLEIRRATREGDLPRQAAELAAMDLDLIVAAALPQALAMRAANPKQPMVVATAAGLVSNGFAQSLERPGGVVTGMEELTPGITARRLELLAQAAPGLKRVALLSTTPGIGGHEMQLTEAETAASRLGIAITPYRATTEAELKQALAAIAADRHQGVQLFQGGLALGQRHAIVRFCEAQRLPAIYQSALFVHAGGLMAYAPDQEVQFRQAARFVDRILKGARPGDLPILRPDRYLLTVNRTAAAEIGLTLSQGLTAKADVIVDHGQQPL